MTNRILALLVAAALVATPALASTSSSSSGGSSGGGAHSGGGGAGGHGGFGGHSSVQARSAVHAVSAHTASHGHHHHNLSQSSFRARSPRYNNGNEPAIDHCYPLVVRRAQNTTVCSGPTKLATDANGNLVR